MNKHINRPLLAAILVCSALWIGFLPIDTQASSQAAEPQGIVAATYRRPGLVEHASSDGRLRHTTRSVSRTGRKGRSGYDLSHHVREPLAVRRDHR